jgi:sulfate adenylyltransferase
LRTDFALGRWQKVVAFHPPHPRQRAQHALAQALRATTDIDARLLLHPIVGASNPGDVDHYARVRSCQSALAACPADIARLSLLPLVMRVAGPREALWLAIIAKNFGCTHLIVERDQAGSGVDVGGRSFHEAHEARDLARRHERESGVGILEMPERVSAMNSNRDLPDQPRARRGFTVFFTGLSGAGKSTIANVLLVRLMERGSRPVTLLDGDIVRKHLSSELGFSKEHRDINIRRIGFVASEITKNGGIALCAPIAPYDSVRREVRTMIEAVGGFVLVHVATPLAVCEQRDRKGLYAKARAGLVPDFTGISQPYEAPLDAELLIDTTNIAPHDAADIVLDHLERQGYLPPAESHRS